MGTTSRRRLTPHRRLQVWERTAGVCVICHQRINGVRERWIAEHFRALELGGTDELANLGPAHERCARSKTQDDHRRAARAKRQKIRHLGAHAAKRPLPFGRNSAWKRTLSGQIIPR
ncbi:HNH endonuclease [Microvirga sp. SM9]|nr:HNH endonuclease [Microvirga lenta]